MDRFVIRLPRTSVPANSEPIVFNVPTKPASNEPNVHKEAVVTNTKQCHPIDVEGSSIKIRRTSDGEELFDITALESNPGLRKSISDYPLCEQNKIRRAYLVKGPCQPNHKFSLTNFGDQNRGFSEKWYTHFGNWIEYSISKDAAFCLYCYLLKNERGAVADNFIVDGFRNWKKNKRLQEHVGQVNSAHNKAYMLGQNLLNQNQSFVTAMTKQTNQTRIDYKHRLEASIKVVRLLLVLDDQFDMYYLEMTKNIEFSELNEIEKLSIKMVETGKSLVYPQVYRLITFALILPVITATVERAFSAMKLVKPKPVIK